MRRTPGVFEAFGAAGASEPPHPKQTPQGFPTRASSFARSLSLSLAVSLSFSLFLSLSLSLFSFSVSFSFLLSYYLSLVVLCISVHVSLSLSILISSSLCLFVLLSLSLSFLHANVFSHVHEESCRYVCMYVSDVYAWNDCNRHHTAAWCCPKLKLQGASKPHPNYFAPMPS